VRGLGPASVGGVVVVLVLIVSSGLPSEVTDIMRDQNEGMALVSAH